MYITEEYPIQKIEEDKSTYENIKNYKKEFENHECEREILIPNIKKICKCIYMLNKTKERFIKGKVLFEDNDKFCILIYDPFMESIKKFIVSKDYFYIDDMGFLNFKNSDKIENTFWML